MPENLITPASLFILMSLASAVAALVIWHRSKDVSVVSLGWFFVILAVPVLGPAAFLIGSRLRAGAEEA